MNPQYEKAWFHKGRCELQLRRLDDADATFQHLQRLNVSGKLKSDIADNVREVVSGEWLQCRTYLCPSA